MQQRSAAGPSDTSMKEKAKSDLKAEATEDTQEVHGSLHCTFLLELSSPYIPRQAQ